MYMVRERHPLKPNYLPTRHKRCVAPSRLRIPFRDHASRPFDDNPARKQSRFPPLDVWDNLRGWNEVGYHSSYDRRLVATSDASDFTLTAPELIKFALTTRDGTALAQARTGTWRWRLQLWVKLRHPGWARGPFSTRSR